jgi:hypothetical protein
MSHSYHVTRREMLARCGVGMGLIGLTQVLGDAGFLTAEVRANVDSSRPLAPRSPHFPAKAKRVIHIFANGGPSQVDTFDPKPSLQKYAGKSLPTANLKTERKTGAAFPSPFAFAKRGQSGIEVSELFEHTAKHIDDLCIIRSMYADVPNHEPSLLLMNCGDARLPRPSLGSWLTYGLGTENQNLPGFVVLCPGGYPIQESQNWQAGFLPGVYQGTYVNSQHTDIEKLIENVRNTALTPTQQQRQLQLLTRLNRLHQKHRPGDHLLEARIQSFELAFRMQTEAAEVFDTSREPKEILDAYGPGVQARSLLTARRLIERGVRFVQVWHGAGQPWDNHEHIAQAHRNLANQSDRAIAALISDLKRLGLFEETLIIWGGEFGRTPVVELPGPGTVGTATGRDHNHWGFTVWLAGGGVKGGTVVGATDEFGFKAVENPVHVHDLHATILHLLGFDHEKFTYRYAGRDFRLTDVHGRVIREVLA